LPSSGGVATLKEINRVTFIDRAENLKTLDTDKPDKSRITADASKEPPRGALAY
jgi:hypothetical protein